MIHGVFNAVQRYCFPLIPGNALDETTIRTPRGASRLADTWRKFSKDPRGTAERGSCQRKLGSKLAQLDPTLANIH